VPAGPDGWYTVGVRHDWYRDYLGLCNEHRFDELGRRFVGDGVVVNGEAVGVGGYVRNLRSMVAPFADFRWELLRLLAGGDRLAVVLRVTGTHTAPYRDISATGRVVRTHEVAQYRVAHGRIVEVWGAADELAVLDQLSAPG
jgi:predicted ester cyclase